jgi:integrase
MPKIPFTMRRSGRYYFRKRARWQNGNDVTAIVSLETCCAQEARIRGAALSAHFEKVKQAVSAYFNLDRTLEPEMLKGLFETELRTCLAQLIDKFHDPATDPHSLVRLARTHASAFDLAQRPGTIVELTDEHRRKLAAAGHDEWAIEEVACELDQYCNRDLIADDIMEIMAESLGVEPTPAVIGRLKHIHLLAMAEANRLAAHFLDEDVQSAFDQQEALLAKRRKNGEPLTFASPVPASSAPGISPSAVPALPSLAALESQTANPGAAEQPECVFQTYHAARFSEVIPRILKLARLAGHWTRGLGQYERVLRTFAWITGDKPLGDYNHTDVAKFKNALLQMPSDYRPAKDFKRPFEEVAQTFQLNRHNTRSINTVRRDLSYMSTAYDILAENEWAPKLANTKALDFARVKFGKHKKVSAKTARPVWTVKHMECLFTAPIWTGGGGHLKRLDENAGSEVYHDAAYWLPLLLYYTHATVNEIGGLRTDEVHIDDVTPSIVIKDNDVRAEDGVDGGEKNENRGRMVPLHPEIMRLGFADYVRAIRAEGHRELFPELYLNDARVGGHQFRNIAWRHMSDWIALHMTIPENPISGKKADMHSIRSLGSSFYAQADVPDLMRADIMGHARKGTNALHYSKRVETHGVAQVLAEYRAFMVKQIDVATIELRPRPVRLLPLRHRSRTGKPRLKLKQE